MGKVQVKVRTTSGESQYSSETIASTPMVQSELEEFRESLNLPAMELKIDSMSTKHDTLTTSLERKLATETTSLERKLATQTTSLKRKIENFHDTCSAKTRTLQTQTRTLQTQTRTLQTLANGIDLRTTAIENKPRFAAEKRSGGYLPRGDITDFTELVDYGDIFNPTTGRLTINEEGDFLLHI